MTFIGLITKTHINQWFQTDYSFVNFSIIQVPENPQNNTVKAKYDFKVNHVNIFDLINQSINYFPGR
jgi:hypothetical protein